MQMTFRWYGASDPIPLQHIRQIPGVEGVVSALYDVPVGDAWPTHSLEKLAESIDAAGMRFAVVESIPVHEDIKLGLATRDQFIAWTKEIGATLLRSHYPVHPFAHSPRDYFMEDLPYDP